jgi:ABC-type uncharacterized transport system substrate-binding protein
LSGGALTFAATPFKQNWTKGQRLNKKTASEKNRNDNHRQDSMIHTKTIIGIILILLSIPAYGESLIFVLASYHQNDPFEGPEHAGVIQALQTSEFQDIKIQSYFLDSRRLSKDKINQKIKEALLAINKKRPKIIIALDDLAFSVTAKKVIDMKNIYLVFAGINKPLDEYNAELKFLRNNTPIKNITGVYEYLFSAEQLEFLDLLLKRPCKVAILYSTDYMGEIAKSQILSELEHTPYKDRMELFPVTDMDDLMAAVQTIANRPDIQAYFPLTLSVKDPKKTARLTMKEIAPILTAKIKKIDLGVNLAFTRLGFFGGVHVDSFQMGYQAGLLAVKLLQGYPISNLKIENASGHKITINKKRLNELGLHFDDEILSLVDEFVQ